MTNDPKENELKANDPKESEQQEGEQQEGEQQDYVPIEIELLKIYKDAIEIELHVKLTNSKYIKVCHKKDIALDILKKYESRGLKNLFIKTEDHAHFLAAVNSMVAKRTASPEAQKAPPEETAKNLSAARDILKTIFTKNELDESGRELAKTVADQSVKLINRTNIFQQFKKFKQNCSDEYLHAVVTSYIACGILDTFSWGNEAVKKKVSMASMLCDITLGPEEFKILKDKKGNPTDLPEKILKHPLEVAKLIEKTPNFAEKETIDIVFQHHERPNGKGFPRGLGYNVITVLTAIYIIANYLVEQMFDENYAEEHHEERMYNLVDQITQKFHSGNFKKASEALTKVFGRPQEEE